MRLPRREDYASSISASNKKLLARYKSLQKENTTSSCFPRFMELGPELRTAVYEYTFAGAKLCFVGIVYGLST